MSELEKDLIDLGATSMRLAEDNMRLTAEIERLKGDEYRTMALFVDAVRCMRNAQIQYFAKREHSVLLMAKQMEGKVDKTIANDIFFIELLKKL